VTCRCGKLKAWSPNPFHALKGRRDARYDPAAPNARCYPRVIARAEIDAMPRLNLDTGIDTAIFLSRERDDAR
jgi:hypothetical protein